MIPMTNVKSYFLLDNNPKFCVIIECMLKLFLKLKKKNTVKISLPVFVLGNDVARDKLLKLICIH